ncbi:unnamed protein product, partial [Scytosiphon promiscuus]
PESARLQQSGAEGEGTELWWWNRMKPTGFGIRKMWSKTLARGFVSCQRRRDCRPSRSRTPSGSASSASSTGSTSRGCASRAHRQRGTATRCGKYTTGFTGTNRAVSPPPPPPPQQQSPQPPPLPPARPP